MSTIKIPSPYAPPSPSLADWLRAVHEEIERCLDEHKFESGGLTISFADATILSARLPSIASELEKLERAAEIIR